MGLMEREMQSLIKIKPQRKLLSEVQVLFLSGCSPVEITERSNRLGH